MKACASTFIDRAEKHPLQVVDSPRPLSSNRLIHYKCWTIVGKEPAQLCQEVSTDHIGQN